MLSRVADSIYWTSRYIERAANIARFLEASYQLNLDQPEEQEQWAPLVEITGDREIFSARYGNPTRDNVIHFLLFNPEYAGSISHCLTLARNNARGMREILHPELFEELNSLGKLVPDASSEKAYFHSRATQLCQQIKRTCMLISGVVSETMERGELYSFWRLGEYIERADQTSRLLNVKYFYLLPQPALVGGAIDSLLWGALLQSLDARQVYARTHGLIRQNLVLDLTILDHAFPRSIRFCLNAALDSLNRITKGVSSPPHQLLSELCLQFNITDAEKIIANGVHEFIDEFQQDLNTINHSIFTHFNAAPILPTGV